MIRARPFARRKAGPARGAGPGPTAVTCSCWSCCSPGSARCWWTVSTGLTACCCPTTTGPTSCSTRRRARRARRRAGAPVQRGERLLVELAGGGEVVLLLELLDRGFGLRSHLAIDCHVDALGLQRLLGVAHVGAAGRLARSGLRRAGILRARGLRRLVVGQDGGARQRERGNDCMCEFHVYSFPVPLRTDSKDVAAAAR